MGKHDKPATGVPTDAKLTSILKRAKLGEYVGKHRKPESLILGKGKAGSSKN